MRWMSTCNRERAREREREFSIAVKTHFGVLLASGKLLGLPKPRVLEDCPPLKIKDDKVNDNNPATLLPKWMLLGQSVS